MFGRHTCFLEMHMNSPLTFTNILHLAIMFVFFHIFDHLSIPCLVDMFFGSLAECQRAYAIMNCLSSLSLSVTSSPTQYHLSS